MGITHWSFLSLWPLALIPIVLHLLTRPRSKVVELSTFRFLMESYQHQRRRVQVLDGLLALLRALCLLFLIAALCRPFFEPEGQLWSTLRNARWFGGVGGITGVTDGDAHGELILLMDVSASMNSRSDGRTTLAKARSLAKEILDKAPRGSLVTLVKVGAQSQEVMSRSAPDLEPILRSLDQWEPQPGRANLHSALTELFGAGPRRPARCEAYFFTDGQANSWKEVQVQLGLDQLLPPEAHLTVIDLGPGKTAAVGAGADGAGVSAGNVAVTASAPLRPIVGLPQEVTARVRNFGSAPADVVLRMLLEDAEVGRAQITIAANSSYEHIFRFIPRRAGLIPARVELVPARPDNFPDDDHCLVAVNASPAIRVMLINGNPDRDPLRDGAFYLRAALETTETPKDPRGKPAGTAKNDPAGKAAELAVADNLSNAAAPGDAAAPPALVLREVAENALRKEDFATADVAVCANVRDLPDDRLQALHDFAVQGGGVWIFFGDRTRWDWWHGHAFGNETRPAASMVLSALTVTAPVGDPDRTETLERIGEVDLTHPAFQVFANNDQAGSGSDSGSSDRENADAGESPLRSVGIFRRHELGVKSASARVVMRYGSGAIAAVEDRLGSGRVLVTGFPAHPSWTNLPLKPEFVPLVLRMVTHLARRPVLELPKTVTAGGTADLVLSLPAEPLRLQARLPRGETTPLVFTRVEDHFTASLELGTKAGLIAVQGDYLPAPGALAAPLSAGLVLGIDPAESDPIRADPSALERELGLSAPRFQWLDLSGDASALPAMLSAPREFWRAMIVLVVAVMMVEWFLATRNHGAPAPATTAFSTRTDAAAPAPAPSAFGALRGFRQALIRLVFPTLPDARPPGSR